VELGRIGGFVGNGHCALSPVKCVKIVPFKRMKIEEKIGNQLSNICF
jgi:hypothetical protein